MQIWILIIGLGLADPSSRLSISGAEVLKIERIEIMVETEKQCIRAASDWTYNNFRDGVKAFATCAGRKPVTEKNN